MTRRSTAAILAMGAVVPLAAGLGWWALRAEKTAALAAATRAAPARAAAATLARWEPGSRRTYRFDYDAAGDFIMGKDAAGDRGAFSMSIGGTLTATVVDERDGRRDVEIAIAPEALKSSGIQLSIPPAQLEQEIARPFLVTYSPRGTIEAVAFRGATAAQAGLFLRELASYLQVTVEPAESWTSVELEPAGECLVLNRRLDDGRIRKEKQRFVRVVRSGELVEPDRTDGVPRFTRSGATYQVDAAGRILAAEVDHATIASVEAVHATARGQAHATFTALSSIFDPELARRGAIASLPVRPLTTGPADGEAPGAAEALPSPGELVDAIRVAGTKEDWAALHEAQFKLTRSVSQDASSLRGLTGPDVDPSVLWAIGAAGTPEAQAALADIALDDDRPLETRKQAIDAFHSVPDATQESMTALQTIAEESGDLRENALLAMGGLANRMRGSDPGGANESVDAIVEMYGQAVSDEERLQILDALGNTGSERALPVLETALASPSLPVVVAAVKNLRLITSPRADELLAALLAPGMAPAIRDAAIFAVGFRKLPPLAEVLDRIARSDPSATMRGATLEVLATFLRRDRATDARPIIGWMASHDPDAELRRHAEEALQGT